MSRAKEIITATLGDLDKNDNTEYRLWDDWTLGREDDTIYLYLQGETIATYNRNDDDLWKKIGAEIVKINILNKINMD